MKGKLLLIIGLAVLVLLSGCVMPAGPNSEGGIGGILGGVGEVLGDVGSISEAGFTQTCGERGGEVCGADEVCRGSIFWSVGSALGQFSCCNMTCGKMTEDDECRTGADCDDGNSSTADRCRGTPTKCSHIERICDGPLCTFAPRPLREDPCAGVTCPSGQGCVGGECIPIPQ